ncbi:MAG: glycosyltransferase [Methanobacteriaceae archaeon]|nr:glycosyltransferase [Methanobacteriaceae archaeon]
MRDNQKKWNSDVGWFDLKIKLKRIPSIHPVTVRISEKIIPDADITFATSWDTADFVARLSPKKGEKFYFIQHYEVWDLLNNPNCWKNAEKLGEDPFKIFLSLTDLTPEDPELLKIKKMVEDTYSLPLNKITVSNLLKKLVEEKFDERIKGIVENGVNFDKFYKEINPPSKRPIRIAMPHMTAPYKGSIDGINALKIVKNLHPEIEFVLYGSKSSRDVPKWIKVYERLLSDDELRRLYNSSDIFVNPSWSEGFSLPPLEAMACGCAVVSTEVGAIKDYSINEKTILTSPPRNPHLLAKNIVRLVEDETLRKKIAKNGCQYVQKFTWEHSIDKLELILESSAISK